VLVITVSAAGLGGTFATWSDSETSGNNTIVTGSLDLKVNGSDDGPWGEGVPKLIAERCVVPCNLYGPYDAQLWNAGQCEFPSKAFLVMKEQICTNINPKQAREPGMNSTGYDPDWVPGTAWEDPTWGKPGPYKPEPELVAELGGKVNCTEVDGVGVLGDNCTLGNFTYVWVMEPGYTPSFQLDPMVPWAEGQLPVIPPDAHAYGQGWMNSLTGVIELMWLCPCEPEEISIWFKVMQTPEEYFGLDEINPDPWDADLEPEELKHWLKFNDWPSWSLMADRIAFDMEFDLYLDPEAADMPVCVAPPPNPI
jgi:predicted ribosomally synthesized peptide with SipW-like signal peptide